MKCQYMDELTGGRGIIFATGTPVSTSMTELYTMMRYLQYGTLQQKGLTHFDSWASTFGENFSQIIYTAFDHGITHFDLANNYGPPPGAAEENFG